MFFPIIFFVVFLPKRRFFLVFLGVGVGVMFFPEVFFFQNRFFLFIFFLRFSLPIPVYFFPGFVSSKKGFS